MRVYRALSDKTYLSLGLRSPLSETCGAEILFVDMFGHDVQQPSPCCDVTSTNHDVCLFVTSPDNAFYAGKSLHRLLDKSSKGRERHV